MAFFLSPIWSLHAPLQKPAYLFASPGKRSLGLTEMWVPDTVDGIVANVPILREYCEVDETESRAVGGGLDLLGYAHGLSSGV